MSGSEGSTGKVESLIDSLPDYRPVLRTDPALGSSLNQVLFKGLANPPICGDFVRRLGYRDSEPTDVQGLIEAISSHTPLRDMTFFAVILGITIRSIDYLETTIYAEIRRAPITSIRANPPHGINCVVEFPLRGVGRYSGRAVPVRTIWEFASPTSRPRLVSAFLKNYGQRLGSREN